MSNSVVELIRYTLEPEELLMYAYGKCYQKDTILETIVKHLKHASVLEHVSFTFNLTISRSCLAQVSRHRTAKFTVESQRYVSYKDGFNVYTPIEIRKAIMGLDGKNQLNVRSRQVLDVWKSAHDIALAKYNALLGFGFKKQDARYVLPSSAMCNLLMTIDLRNVINLFHLRLDGHAQEEIRVMALKMLKLAFAEMPNLSLPLTKLIIEEIGEKAWDEAHELMRLEEELDWILKV